MRERYDALPAWGRIIALMLGLTLGAALIAMLVVLAMGQFDAFHLSNAFFFAAAILFLAALVIYWTRPMAPEPEPAQKPAAPADKQGAPGERREPWLRRRARRRNIDMPPLSVAMFIAGLLLFGLSILVGSGATVG